MSAHIYIHRKMVAHKEEKTDRKKLNWQKDIYARQASIISH